MPTLPLVPPLRLSCLLAISLLLSSGFAAEKTPLSPDAETKNLDASLQRILRTASIRPALREDLQRPVDPRLLRIESLGLKASGFFSGKRHEVRNAAEIEKLSGKLKPGDQLILTGSDWKDARFVFGGEGTPEAPIFIGAEKPDSVVLSGTSSARFHGSHLVIMNLTFRDGVIAGATRSVLALGLGKDKPANHCLVNRVTIENFHSAAPADWKTVLVNYLPVTGSGNTVANSTFAHLKNYGCIISTHDVPGAPMQQLHILNNRFIDRPRLDDDPSPYRYKIIQIGWSGIFSSPAGSLIQGNLFEDCSSHVELVSIKASDIFLRANRFVRCLGGVNIRTGDRALIQDNVFDGENRPDTGGLRVAGRDHVIVGNTFTRLRPAAGGQMWPPPKPPTPYLTWTIALVAADYEYSGATDAAYGQIRDTLISHNRFEGNAARIALGSPTPSLSTTQLMPHNVRIEHNTFSGDGKGNVLYDYTAPELASPDALASAVLAYNNRFLP